MVDIKFNRSRRDKVKETLEDFFFFHNAGGFIIALTVSEQPTLTVKIIVTLADYIGSEVDCKYPFDIIVSCMSNGELMFADRLFKAGEIRVHLTPAFLRTHHQHEFSGRCGAALDLIEMPQILLQQPSHLGIILMRDPVHDIPLVIFKAFS